jgi:hypothetical protein
MPATCRSPIFHWDLVIGPWDLIGIWGTGHWSFFLSQSAYIAAERTHQNQLTLYRKVNIHIETRIKPP